MKIRFISQEKTVAELESDRMPQTGDELLIPADTPGCIPGRYAIGGKSTNVIERRFQEQIHMVAVINVRESTHQTPAVPPSKQ